MSKVSVLREDLVVGVQKAYPVTLDNTLESFKTFKIKLENEAMFIAATDNEITFITNIPCTIEELNVNEIVVNSQYFLNIVKNLPSEKDVHFIISEDSLIINCGNYEAVIQSYEGEQAELLTNVVFIEEQDYDDVFSVDKLKLVFEGLTPIASETEGLGIAAIIIHENLAFATDNHIVSMVKITNNRSYAIPVRVARCLMEILENTSAKHVYFKYIEDDSAVLVKAGEDIFYFRCLLVDFNDYPLSSFIDESKETKSVFLLEKSSFLRLLNRISAGKLIKSIEIEVLGTQVIEGKEFANIKIKCSDNVVNTSELLLAVGKNIIPKRFVVDYDGLSQIVRLIQTKEFTMRYNSELDRIAVVSADKEMIALISSMEAEY